MNIMEVFKRFPTQDDCLKRLELARWSKGRTCPYCFSEKTFKYKNLLRYHCNNCNTSFTVIVNTIFQNTKLPLQKWFLAISLMMNAKKGISAKQLQRDLDITYKTAWYMAMRIRRGMVDQANMLMGIIEMDEAYIGGKPRKSNDKGNGPNKRGRGTKKIPVVGMIERGKGGRIIAQVKKPLNS